ncbi:SCO family protein [Flavobacterium sp. ANB]|uniref:SCO family protein n=1 Tax=unclassified Flavobacterium TaxID=196869 RepID=UPI0012B958AA|nr:MULTISPECIES: SCO family protein [unclassified Flavobacterium]MBF4516452.1 SCO family protein [Flavobacterium sp. ANB]MTD69650.1 redoxin domain-containing protein [Flavobacterium sp. LC2016-13]
MKKTIVLLLLVFGLQSCKDFTKETSNPENAKITDISIYNLPSKWTTQNGQNIELKNLKGNVLVMVMIYTSCKAACPKLVADMRDIESKLDKKTKNKVKLVLVSIDPVTDTPKRLKSFAIENKMNQDPWLFLRSTEDNTREFAALLAVNYKQISPMDFSHSNIISVFNTKGELIYQQEGLGVNNDQTINKINEEASKI